MTDIELIEMTVRANLTLINAINRLPWTDELIFSKVLLARGVSILQRKSELTLIERANLYRFCRNWSTEFIESVTNETN